MRVRNAGHGWARFLSMFALDSILALAIALLPPCLVWHLLGPGDFWQRFVAGVVFLIVFGIFGVLAFLFFAYFMTRTTNW